MEEAMIAIVYGLFGVGILVALIYLVIRRIEIKKTEDFEKRDN